MENYIVLHVRENFIQFAMKFDDEEEKPLCHHNKFGIECGELVSYWFSYDRDALVLKYGKGHIMEETTLMTYDFLAKLSPEKKKEIRKKYYLFFNAEKKKSVLVKSKKCVEEESLNALIDVTPRFNFRQEPLVNNYPPFVVDSSKVTLFDLDRNENVFSSSLPKACLELYENIKGLSLEYPENPIMKLSDAIRYSINTPGMTLYKKLREKSGEFPYLRVTLGPNQRTAPGIPYVLEIWPAGAKSPIHNHGGSCAVIKNLFGRITCNIFNKLKDPPEDQPNILKKFDLREGQVTWISPNWFQTHRLDNNTNDFCATIQCYRYDFSDTIHWPGFDYMEYVEEKEKYELEEFLPNTDFTFINLRSIVLKEYQEYLQTPT